MHPDADAPTGFGYVGPRYGIWITERERKRLLLLRGACYLALLAYLTILLVNAAAIVACFLCVALGSLKLDWQYLASWAGGTTGLGAGSLVFKSVLDYLFGVGGGHSAIGPGALKQASVAPPKNS